VAARFKSTDARPPPWGMILLAVSMGIADQMSGR
jgi:hypothetical protein